MFPKSRVRSCKHIRLEKKSGEITTVIQRAEVDEILRPRSDVWSEPRGRIKPSKQIPLPYAVKTLTDNVELIQMLNR